MKVVILYFCLSINCELLLVAIQFKARFWSSVSSAWGFLNHMLNHMSIVFCAKATEPAEGPQLLGCLPWNGNPAAQAYPRCNFTGLGLLWTPTLVQVPCLKPFWFSVQYWVCNMFLQNITKSSGNSVVLVVPRCFLTMWLTAPHPLIFNIPLDFGSVVAKGQSHLMSGYCKVYPMLSQQLSSSPEGQAEQSIIKLPPLKRNCFFTSHRWTAQPSPFQRNQWSTMCVCMHTHKVKIT